MSCSFNSSKMCPLTCQISCSDKCSQLRFSKKSATISSKSKKTPISTIISLGGGMTNWNYLIFFIWWVLCYNWSRFFGSYSKWIYLECQFFHKFANKSKLTSPLAENAKMKTDHIEMIMVHGSTKITTGVWLKHDWIKNSIKHSIILHYSDWKYWNKRSSTKHN